MCSVHDTVEFEKRGVPATLFLTQIFRNSAITQFRNKGMDGHPYIELPHPVSNLTPGANARSHAQASSVRWCGR